MTFGLNHPRKNSENLSQITLPNMHDFVYYGLSWLCLKRIINVQGGCFISNVYINFVICLFEWKFEWHLLRYVIFLIYYSYFLLILLQVSCWAFMILEIRNGNFLIFYRSSHWRCSLEKRSATSLKRDSNKSVFLWDLRNFKNTFFKHTSDGCFWSSTVVIQHRMLSRLLAYRK